jgi:hypothetical protein
MTDYPDYQTFPNAQSDNVFPLFTQTLAPGLHSTGIIPALSWSSMMIAITPSAGACQVQINHYADLAGTMQIDADNWSCNAVTALRVRTPLRGKYVRIDIFVTSPGNLTAATWANFLSATSDRISFPVSTQNLSDFAHVAAANADIKYTSGEICAGQALFYFKPYTAGGLLAVVLHAVDELGNPSTLIADFGKPTALVQQLITVPDRILQVEILNSSGTTAVTYDFSLTVPPQ